MLSDEEKEEINAAAAAYPVRQAAAIDALRIVQRRRGWVPDEAIAGVSEFLKMPAAELDGVASFYNLIFRRPVGRHVILVCDSVSCWLMKSDRLLERMSGILGVETGQTTADGRFTLLPSVCLGACDRAPVMMIDEDLHTDLDGENIDKILERYE